MTLGAPDRVRGFGRDRCTIPLGWFAWPHLPENAPNGSRNPRMLLACLSAELGNHMLR